MRIRNNIKRSFAGFLLALFVFIQAEKNLHEHTQAESCEIGSKPESFGKINYCFICDFQIATDADIPVNNAGTSITSFNKFVSPAGTTCCLQEPILSFSQRGPPQIVPAFN